MKPLSPKALEAARARNLAAIERLNEKIAADKERQAARVREREAAKRNRVPNTLDALEAARMCIDVQALRQRGDVLIEGKWTAIAPPPALRAVVVTRTAIRLLPLSGAAQMIPLRWRKTVGPFELCAAKCDCGRLVLKLYPKSFDGGPWGCRYCCVTGARRDSGDKHRAVNRVRVRPPVYRGAPGHEVCERDERGRFLRRDKRTPSARLIIEPPRSEPAPIIHQPFGPCEWTPRRG